MTSSKDIFHDIRQEEIEKNFPSWEEQLQNIINTEPEPIQVEVSEKLYLLEEAISTAVVTAFNLPLSHQVNVRKETKSHYAVSSAKRNRFMGTPFLTVLPWTCAHDKGTVAWKGQTTRRIRSFIDQALLSQIQD